MFLHLTRTCLVLVFSVVNAQLYNDMGAAYTDQASVYGDEDTDDVGTYDNGYDDYEDEDLAHINFSADKLKELYSCLCMGGSKACSIHYQLEGDTWEVSLIHRNGTFEGDDNLCKFYLCSHDEVNQQITCSQVAERSEACESAAVVQFFRFKSHVCCGLTCIGLFWYSVEEQISFVQNVSDVESCDDSCLCSDDGGIDAPKAVKIMSNDTKTDIYIIHNPVRNISTTRSSTSVTASTLRTSKINKWESTTTSNNSNPLVKSPFSDSSADSNTTFIIIVATAAAVVVIAALIIVVAFIIKRNKRQRKLVLKTNKDKSLETGSAPVIEPHLSGFSPISMGKLTKQYSRIPSAGADISASDSHKQSSEAPGFKNGINKPENTNKEPKSITATRNEYNSQNEIKRGNNSGNRIVKNRMPSESAGLISGRSENESGNFRVSPGSKDLSSPSKDVSVRQPLLLRSEVKESVV